MIAAGDSFTYGEELNDIQQAWPCLVAKKLNMIEWTVHTPQGWGHFLDEGHRIVADKILDHLSQLNYQP